MELIQLDSKRKKVDEVNSDALELIESMISRVKSGEITAIGISWVNKDGSIGGDTSSGTQNITLWASLEHNAREFYNNLVNDAE